MRRRDLCFIFILINLVLFSITMTGLYLNKHVIEYSFIMEQISFASSIVSILLAIIAILYAFVQSYQSGIQNQETQNLLTLISHKVEGINVVKNEVVTSKTEIKNELTKMHAVIDNSYKQIDSQKETSYINKHEVFKSYIDSYFKNTIDELNFESKDGINKDKEFHVTLILKELKDPYLKTTNSYDIVDEYLTYFKNKTSLRTFGSNILVFSDYYGMSFTLSFPDNDHAWTPKKVKDMLTDYEHSNLEVFTVAKLDY
ncbi:hypothetical protein BAQ53_24425 [Bacillus sp. B25(2016b)]|uniref:hypothetical protein n=1 Tax=Bacillus sp. B25(2016b) TaxID=1868655 RepID=UPI0008044F68|nr:hypothetical protein [Bacillus sp. B25(2016b)]ANP83875.1 hypothetical protein BAQ53_24425 [Bacillus sp. B25(2016b)]